MGCLESMNYEILAKNLSFKEARKVIIDNSDEVYEVKPGFKLLDKVIIGVPPILVGIKDEKLVYTYTKPCYGTFIIIVDDDLEGLESVKKNGKPYHKK